MKILLTLILLAAVTGAFGADPDREAIEKDVFEVLDTFMASFNSMDSDAHVSTLHLPHFRLARGAMTSLETKEEAIAAHKSYFETLPDTGWHKSKWVHRKIIHMSENKVHVDIQFRRDRKDGTEITTASSLYVLIKKDGRWGVKMKSSFLR